MLLDVFRDLAAATLRPSYELALEAAQVISRASCGTLFVWDSVLRASRPVASTVPAWRQAAATARVVDVDRDPSHGAAGWLIASDGSTRRWHRVPIRGETGLLGALYLEIAGPELPRRVTARLMEWARVTAMALTSTASLTAVLSTDEAEPLTMAAGCLRPDDTPDRT